MVLYYCSPNRLSERGTTTTRYFSELREKHTLIQNLQIGYDFQSKEPEALLKIMLTFLPSGS